MLDITVQLVSLLQGRDIAVASSEEHHASHEAMMRGMNDNLETLNNGAAIQALRRIKEAGAQKRFRAE